MKILLRSNSPVVNSWYKMLVVNAQGKGITHQSVVMDKSANRGTANFLSLLTLQNDLVNRAKDAALPMVFDR